jgi:hypothetical protein
MKTAAKPAPTRALLARDTSTRIAVRSARIAPRATARNHAAAAAPAPRSPRSPEEIARLIAEEQRLADATPIGGWVYSELLGMETLKLQPITDEDVYALY